MTHEFTEPQALLFLIFGAVTFVSYQTIPNNLDRMSAEGRGLVAKSVEFTLFVRVCGFDHALMVAYMCFPVLLTALPDWFGWAVVASSGATAAISGLSAFVIRRATV